MNSNELLSLIEELALRVQVLESKLSALTVRVSVLEA